MSLLAIKYERGKLEILNQLLLPHESIYEEIQSVEDGWGAIRSMKVRSRQMINSGYQGLLLYYHFAVSLLSEYCAKAFLEFCIIEENSRERVVNIYFSSFIRTLHFPCFDTLKVKTSCLDTLKDLLGPVARDMVSANHGLNSIETYTFLALVVNTG